MEQMMISSIKKLEMSKSYLFTANVLHILNGQSLYDVIQRENRMKATNYVPFNEAMCVHDVVEHIFSAEFQQVRALGHHSTVREYNQIVLRPLERLFNESYDVVVLWFGEDLFCQMNMLTILAYLEQSDFAGDVILHHFKEDEWEVTERVIKLGSFTEIYNTVLVDKNKIEATQWPILQNAIELYFELLQKDNRVTQFIKRHTHISEKQLIILLFAEFPEIGYGDVQYIELIERFGRQ